MTAPHLTPRQVGDLITGFLNRDQDATNALFSPTDHERWETYGGTPGLTQNDW